MHTSKWKLFLGWMFGISLLLHHPCIAQKQDVRIFYDKVSTSEFYVKAINTGNIPYVLRLNFDESNYQISVPYPHIQVIQPDSMEVIIAHCVPKDRNKASHCNVDAKFILGEIETAKHEKDFMYALPYAPGKSHRIVQGYQGKLTHQGVNALDFDLDEGTPVHAVRDGKVIRCVTHNQKGCKSMSCKKYVNVISIQHADGTIAEYAHLAYQGAVVQPGQMVIQGQLIGYSGNTGYTYGPHLHLVVYEPSFAQDEIKTVTTKFRTKEFGVTTLKENKLYTNPE